MPAEKAVTLVATAIALAVGLAACGSGAGSTASSASTATSTAAHAEASKPFVPEHHHDSGGGSGQFLVKGGDNSIQEFGSEAGGAEFEEAAAAVHGFLDARAAGDWKAACSYLARSVTASFGRLAGSAGQASKHSCAGVLGKLINPAAGGEMKAEAERANVGSLRAEGERGFVIYRVGRDVLAIPLTKEGGEWKVSTIAATPLS